VEAWQGKYQHHHAADPRRFDKLLIAMGKIEQIFAVTFGLRVLPDRQVVTMDKPFLSAYSRLLIKTCHKRGAFAMGGMAAFI
ncbi:hypothetical protein, partial [Citrobacter braakii]|uniref:hypothetical protein n=1 Tax=Citrobacter braakii TaxID=57706 RepID=UPI00378A5903